MMKRLTIISHTEHYKTSDGHIVGLGSTVTEINNLLEVFDEIYHIGMLHNTAPPQSALPYNSDNIIFIPIPSVGGPRLIDKLSIVWQMPKILRVVKRTLKQTDYFQFRAPTGIGVFVLPYLVLFSRSKGWFKYAGNWKQEKPPLAYRFQRWLLKNQKRKVTINGKWEGQPNQCLTFENPCLTESEIIKGQEIIKNKTLQEQTINFCFVGRLEDEKGVALLINAFKMVSKTDKEKIGRVHLVGNGKDVARYKELVKGSTVDFVFHGFLSRENVHAIYKESHAIILPSASEGFPKVIAEALNFGCLPIVSNISAIGHYIKNDVNGFLLSTITSNAIVEALQLVLNMSQERYSNLLKTEKKDIFKFSYPYYNKRISEELLIE